MRVHFRHNKLDYMALVYDPDLNIMQQLNGLFAIAKLPVEHVST